MGSIYKTGLPISPYPDENVQQIKKLTGNSIDIVIRPFILGSGQKAVAFYVDGLIDNDMLGRDFFAQLMNTKKEFCSVDDLADQVLTLGEVTIANSLDEVMEMVLQAMTALFVEGQSKAVCIEAINWPQRSVDEPGTDVVIRGPREGFIEALRPNLALLRRKIHHPDLRVESVRLGRYSRTDVGIVYISSIVNENVLKQVRERLSKIDIDAVLDSGQIEQLLQDTPYSLLPTVGVAEKPDIAAARILEGRVCILVDGSPVSLTVPMLFVEGLSSPEDYYTRFYYASWVRMIRYLAFAISVWFPAFFLAVVCYHQQIIPLRLLLSMIASEATTPFSVGFSFLLIGLSYEILREAGIRLPKPAGQAISIVGAIVLGDAAVSAGLISSPVLIVLAITVVASFVSSYYADSCTLLRLIFLAAAWAMGFFGLLTATLIFAVYLCSLESFGIAFFAPVAPFDKQAMKDTAGRWPIRLLQLRPWYLSSNRRRMADMRDTHKN